MIYTYRWNRQGRKGQRCKMLCRGTMNSCLLEFEDGYRMVTSRNAIRKLKEEEEGTVTIEGVKYKRSKYSPIDLEGWMTITYSPVLKA